MLECYTTHRLGMRLLFHYGNCGQSNTRRTRHQKEWDGLLLFIACDVTCTIPTLLFLECTRSRPIPQLGGKE